MHRFKIIQGYLNKVLKFEKIPEHFVDAYEPVSLERCHEVARLRCHQS